MSESKTTDVLVNIVNALAPLSSEERQRVVKAALTLLGEDPVHNTLQGDTEDSINEKETNFTPRTNSWIKQNGLTFAELEHVFHLGSEGVEFIASDVPGKNQKEKTHSAYILCGAKSLLSDGGGTFEDKAARAMCENLGCYNQANHAVYMKSIGNAITGSKTKGWTLTVPGQKKAAKLIKDLAGNA